MSVLEERDKRELAVALLESAESAVRAKRRMAEGLDAKRVRRVLTSRVHAKLLERTEQELAAALEPLFVRQAESIARRLGGGKGYDPSQPRVPAGQPGGGQFGSGGGGSSGGESSGKPRAADSDRAAAILDRWATPSVGSRQGAYEKVREEGEKWVRGEKNEGFDDLYKETQSRLKEQSIDEMVLYRTISVAKDSPLGKAVMEGKLSDGDSFKISGETMESWTESHAVAQKFAFSRRINDLNEGKDSVAVIMERTVKAKDIVSSHRTHSGFLPGEQEAMVRRTESTVVRLVGISGKSKQSPEMEFDISGTARQNWLILMTEDSGKSVSDLDSKSAREAARMVRRAFDPDEWRDDLVDLALPVLAVGMARAVAGQLTAMGVRVPKRKAGKKSVESGLSSKAKSTASRWLDEHPDDLEALDELVREAGVPGFSVLTEMPERMKRRIAEALDRTFSEDYWKGISETTGGDAERILRMGLDEGWSIRRMAQEMRESLGGDQYARTRAMNIARTESGWALNDARRQEMDGLAEDLGGKLKMRQVWLSVLGPTTRITHADLDGVPADEDGQWDLAGYKVSCPGDPVLPPEERCSCFPAGTFVSGDFVGSQRAWYDGTFTEVVLRSGGRVTMTPNHPVVTSKGLVSAGKLKPGQKVLTYGPKANHSASLSVRGGDQEQYEPVMIEELFEAFLSGSAATSSTVEVIRCKMDDFYGDAVSFQGDVDVVRSRWELLEDGKFGRFEKRGDSVFILSLPADSEATLLTEPVLCSVHPAGYLVRGGLPNFPCLSEPELGSRRPVGNITPSGSLSVGVAPDIHTSLHESSRQDGPAVSRFLRESLEGNPGTVQFDEVVEVRDFYSAGHVYDLQSTKGFIVAYGSLYTDNRGLLTANCQCSISLEWGMGDDEARPLIQDYYDRQAAGEEEQ